jgi:hypothetical protein
MFLKNFGRNIARYFCIVFLFRNLGREAFPNQRLLHYLPIQGWVVFFLFFSFSFFMYVAKHWTVNEMCSLDAFVCPLVRHQWYQWPPMATNEIFFTMVIKIRSHHCFNPMFFVPTNGNGRQWPPMGSRGPLTVGACPRLLSY